MIKRLLTMALIGLLLSSMGCATTRGAGTGISNSPELVGQAIGGGVLVVFGNMGTEDEPEYCPIAVVTTDDECVDFGGRPADHVCRWTQDSPGKSIDQRQVLWKGGVVSASSPAGALLFNIEFKTSPDPCQNNLGANPAAVKNCVAKTGAKMGFPVSDLTLEAVFEYGVTAPGCETLDPYIVFRR